LPLDFTRPILRSASAQPWCVPYRVSLFSGRHVRGVQILGYVLLCAHGRGRTFDMQFQ